MKRISTYFILTTLLFCCSNIYAQRLTLTDLISLCNKKNWEDVNQTLLAKKWTYYESEKGSTYEYSTIIWSYNKEYYSDKAQAWFHLYTYEDLPSKIVYFVSNKESYSIIQNSIASLGFKLINSEIEDNELISTYSNSKYTLEISTEKRNDDDWENKSITTYLITLIKKAGIYDADNGKKIKYYYDSIVDDIVKVECTLLNGEFHGQLKTYYNNGNLKKTGSYSNGKGNGLFKEYDENENLNGEYSMSNGKLHGQIKSYYPNGKLEMIGNYSNGKKNGLFKVYDESGNLEFEYSMSNDKLHGQVKSYYPNGKFKKTGSYSNGKENGLFKEYDENGNLEVEYSMSNGERNGVLKVYEDGKISYSTEYKDDTINGQHIEYAYDDETGKLELKQIGEYLNAEKNGTWKLFFIEDNKEQLLTFTNYTEGVKNGFFQNIKGDSVILGSYKDNKLHGEYKVYLDLNRYILNQIPLSSLDIIDGDTAGLTMGNVYGGMICTDTSKLRLINEGSFYEGLKSGYWKNYYTTGPLSSEGKFSNGQETGEWKYYYRNWHNAEGEKVPYAEELFLIQNYSYGKLNGKSTRFSYLDEEEILCPDNDDNMSLVDTCKRLVYHKINEIAFYKDDKLNGIYELKDSNNNIIAKGFYNNDLREGEWTIRYDETDIYGKPYSIYEKGNFIKDKREGKWIKYSIEGKIIIIETFNYQNGKLNGEYIIWNQSGKPREKNNFLMINSSD